MEIDYTNSRVDSFAHSKFASKAVYSRMASNHYWWVTYWGVMAALGIYASLSAHLLGIAVFLFTMFVVYFAKAVPYSRVLKDMIRRNALIGGSKRVRLRIDDEGMRETVEGLVESFAPWSALKRFVITDEHLFIELAGDLWANIPRKSIVQGETAFHELVTTLRLHKVPEEITSKV
jgi:hypothetical protein